MAGPITWRNVNGPALPDVGRAMQAASSGFNGAFDMLGDVIKKREAMDASNTLITQENAKNSFLDSVAQYKTPEALAAAQPLLDEQRAALDPRSRAAVRGTEEARTNALRTQMQEAWKYDNAVVDQREAPVRDAYLAAVAKGDVLTANIIESGNPNLRNKAPLAQAFADGQQKIVTQGRDTTRFANEQTAEERKVAAEAQLALTRPLEIQGLQSRLLTEAQQRAASAASILASQESTASSQASRTRAERDLVKAETAAKLTVALQDNIYKDGVYTDANSADIMKLMIDNGVGGPKEASDSPAKRQKIIERLSKIREIPITVDGPDGQKIIQKVPLPLGAVKAAILGAGDNLLSWNEGRADNVETALKAQLQAIYQSKDATGKPIVASRAADDYQNYLSIQRAAAEAAATGGTTKPKKPK